MKVRYGFVSNSSSSSFTCDVCGHNASGWDMDCAEAQIFLCENGHSICYEHGLISDRFKKYMVDLKAGIEKAIKDDDFESLDKYRSDCVYIENLAGATETLEEIQDFLEDPTMANIPKIGDYRDEMLYAAPADVCPICAIKNIDIHTMARYLLLKTGQTAREVASEMCDAFVSHKKMHEKLREVDLPKHTVEVVK